MGAQSSWSRRDWALVTLLSVAVVLSRLPFRSHLLFNWDAADFALALRHYDVTQFQPHPPGYPVYIALAWLFSLVLADHNASLVAVSLLFSALAVAALYALGRAVGGWRTGLIAALLLAGSVTYWTYGGLALAYVSLAFFSGLAALWGYETLLLGRDRLLPLSALYAVAGGFRAELLLFLCPLWLACLLAAPRRRALAAAALASAIVLAWALPMMLLSGGAAAYLALLLNYSDQDVVRRYSVPARGFEGLWVNLRDTASYVFYSMYAIAPLFIAASVSWAARGNTAKALFLCVSLVFSGRRTQDAGLGLLGWAALWVGPMILFYNLIHVGDPGYVFSFYPALLLFTARWLAGPRTAPALPRADTEVRPYAGAGGIEPIPSVSHPAREGEGPGARASRPPVAPGTTSADTADAPRRTSYRHLPGPRGDPLSLWERARVRAGRAGSRFLLVATAVGLVLAANTAVFLFHQRPLTAWGVRAADAALAARLAYVQERFGPGEAVLLASDSVRHLRYYLPDYREYWVDRLSPFERRVPLPEGLRAVVLFDPDLLPLAPDAEAVDLGEARLGVLPAQPGQAVTYGRGGIGVE